jgi:hypothetical protein
MTRFYLKVHGELVRQGLENFDEEIPKVGRQRIYLRMLRIKTRLSQPARKPGYPIQWDSEKQKRAYFATDGFGKGIPYQRDGGTERAWDLQSLEDGYRLANESQGAFFVFGDLYKRKSQSRIHAGRWPETKVVTFEELAALPEEIQADIEAAKKRSGL